MNFLKILQGQKTTGAEVLAEIENLKIQQSEKSDRLKTLDADLRAEWLDVQAGKSDKNMKGIQSEIEGLKTDIRMIEETLKDMGALHESILALEKTEAIKKIDAEIADIENQRKQMTDEFLKKAGEAAALYGLIQTTADSFRAGPRYHPLPGVENFDTGIFIGSVNKALAGRHPFQNRLSDLYLQKQMMKA